MLPFRGFLLGLALLSTSLPAATLLLLGLALGVAALKIPLPLRLDGPGADDL